MISTERSALDTKTDPSPALHIDGPLIRTSGGDRLARFAVRTPLTSVELTAKPLAVLLQLIDARARFDGGCLPREELGDERNLDALWKSISDLRRQLGPAYAKGSAIVRNKRGKGYHLDAQVVIGRINKAELANHPDEAVREIARCLPTRTDQ